jgi:adenosylcobinamide kinase/adenosylcobinamide-phosphate guanylyltransferase
MAKIIFITGGARSGKSQFAEQIVLNFGEKIAYIATAVVTDKDMEQRIKHHQKTRLQTWQTIEKYHTFQDLGKLEQPKAEAYILDCVTVMITNLMMDSGLDFEQVTTKQISELETEIKEEIEELLQWVQANERNIVIVSNEVGLGLVPAYRLGSIFRDISGRINQLIARQADEVYFVVSGIPMKIKG